MDLGQCQKCSDKSGIRSSYSENIRPGWEYLDSKMFKLYLRYARVSMPSILRWVTSIIAESFTGLLI